MIRRTKNGEGKEVARVSFDLRPNVEEEKKVIDILEDIEGDTVFLRDAVTRFADSDYFKENRKNRYDGPGHHKPLKR